MTLELKVDTNEENWLRVATEYFIKEELKMEIKLRNAGKIGERGYVIENSNVKDKHFKE